MVHSPSRRFATGFLLGLGWACGVLAPLGGGASAWGQSAYGLIGPEQLAPYGLERMWSIQMEMNRATSRLAGLSQHVSSTNNYTVFEFEFDGRSHMVTEFEKNAFGNAIGVDGAKKRAEEHLAQLQLLWTESGRKGAAPAPKIVQKVVPRVTMVAASDRGAIHCFDGETGKTRWAVAVGNPNYPTSAAGVTDQFVAVVNGSTAYLLQADDGAVEWSHSLAGATIGGPVLSEKYVFVPRINGGLETINIEKHKLRMPVYKSYGQVMMQPAISTGSIAWGTSAGHLVVGLAKEPVIRFRVEARDAIVGKPAFHPSAKIFFTSLDGYIYCVNEVSGQVVWRFSTGEPIHQSPLPAGDSVYVVTNEGHLYAIRIDLGEERYVLSGIRTLLAASDQRLYAIDFTGSLAVIDSTTGAGVGAIPLTGLDFPVVNPLTDRVLIGKSTGTIQCLRESRLRWPYVHEFADPTAKKNRPAAVPPAAQPKPQPMNQVDPFAPAGADPFAPAPAAGGGAAAAANDPFAPAAPAAAPAAPAQPMAVDPFAP